MEPTNLTPPPDEDAALAGLFRAHSPEIADDGFSARVVEALPPPRIEVRWSWLAYVVGGLAGASIAIFRAVPEEGFDTAGRKLLEALTPVAAAMVEPWFLIGLVITALSLSVTSLFARPHRWQW